MRAKISIITFALAASTAGAAPMHHPAAGKATGSAMQPCCPMCAQIMKAEQKMSGMQSGRPSSMMGQMQPMTDTTQGIGPLPAITVGTDGTILVLHGGTLYKYSADLKLLGSVRLPASAPPAGMDMAPPAAGAAK